MGVALGESIINLMNGVSACMCFTCFAWPASLSQVYLDARRREQQKHQQSLKMLSDEVSQIQEVRLHLLTVPLTHTTLSLLLSLGLYKNLHVRLM